MITGTVSAATVVTRGTSPTYRCTLDDGTGQLDLLFLGRRSVPGLTVGMRCSAEGTVLAEGSRLVVWNPLYRLETPDTDVGSRPPVAFGLGSAATTTSPTTAAGPAEPPDTDPEDTAELVEAAGRFRIYLGAAAGVGKTVAMLDEAQRRRQRGADVVIGIVETHGRPVTRARMARLEVVPRRRVAYRGAVLEEMDLDAVLHRRPKVALVDELAHTNVPGSGRHEKRWQDVFELIEGGIDVITTVNIQHLESIADAVERITGVPVRERVPDWVVRRADQIELVDSSPEQLRRRMVHGNIYPPDKVPQALTHFFRADNLTALRELALRFLADETEEELLEHLLHHQTDVVWDTAERIMVGVTAAPGTDTIVRRASRMAARIKADLHVVHVTGGDTSHRSEPARLDQLRRVAADVGAAWHEVHAEDPVEALIDFARRNQITQIVIGSSQRSRWQELIGGGSIVKRVTRRAAGADVDVHIIARRRDPERKVSRAPEAAGRASISPGEPGR
ncbi:MAG TPA: universal stress protein [Acidimicrobiales bacterium]|nr:universal stress protein [Acidimicrobiales bacterium]